jgi:hypothetical protein
VLEHISLLVADAALHRRAVAEHVADRLAQRETFTPSVVIPSATMLVRPLRSIPSSISTARRTSSSRRAISSPSASRVR